MTITTRTHVISIPHSTLSHFVVSVAQLSGSLHVWCGPASAQLLSSMASSDEQQAGNDDDNDDEITRALREAGRLPAATESGSGSGTATATGTPQGALASEWAVAISLPGRETMATSLYRTNADLARGMARRIAQTLKIPQLFLSLDVPPPLLPSSTLPQNPEDSLGLLALEKGIRDVCRTAVSAPAPAPASAS